VTPDLPDEALSLTLDLDGYEGPLHVLLDLAKAQKVDLRQISITTLADQYLMFIAELRTMRLEIAGDYLVMAAWLAYLKSKLLLPKADKTDEGPAPQDIAARLAYRLHRLHAMRRASEALMALPQWGVDVLGRAVVPRGDVDTHTDYTATLYDLIAAYGEIRNAKARMTYKPPKPHIYPLEDARERLATALVSQTEWRSLTGYTPRDARLPGAAPAASYAASLLSAALELTKDERALLRQADRNVVPEVRGI
jgi:segregation and condensation protein A